MESGTSEWTAVMNPVEQIEKSDERDRSPELFAVAISLALLLLLSPVSVQAQANTRKIASNSAEMFDALKLILTHTPDLPLEEFRRLLRENSVACPNPGDAWCTLSDAEGRLLVELCDGTKSGFLKGCFLKFFPATHSSVPSPLLQALMSNGTAFSISANTIEFALPQKTLSEKGHHGTLNDWLTFSLADGAWIQTNAHVDWSDDK